MSQAKVDQHFQTIQSLEKELEKLEEKFKTTKEEHEETIDKNLTAHEQLQTRLDHSTAVIEQLSSLKTAFADLDSSMASIHNT